MRQGRFNREAILIDFMQCNRKLAVVASLGVGAICAAIALDTSAPETPLVGRAARGTGNIINGAVDIFGASGAAIVFVLLGFLMAVVSALVCPSARD